MKKENHKPTKDFKERYDLIRNPERIRSSDIIEGVFEKTIYFDSPDPSLIAAKGNINGLTCMILGQEKRRKGKESQATGMMTAKGYAFTLEMLDEAEKRHMPVVSFIDTFGGDTSMESELGGQSFLISDCISRYCGIETPTISYIIGEGGSGGALGLQVADKSFMFENALYSVIAPESCSRIIFQKRLNAGESIEETIKDSLEVLRPGAEHIKEIGMIDEILPEPEDGAHNDYEFTINIIKDSLTKTLNEWIRPQKIGKKIIRKKTVKKLLKERREKVLNFGKFYGFFDKLAKRVTKRSLPKNIKIIDIERGDFYTMGLLKAHLEKEGIGETELYECEKEWDKEHNKFRVAGGCGFVSFDKYVENFYACPKCGKGQYLSIEEQIEKVCDKNTFLEIEGALVIKQLVRNERYNFGRYKELLGKIKGKTFSKEALVTGMAKINGRDVV